MKDENYKDKFENLMKRLKLIQENLDSVLLDQSDAYYASDSLNRVIKEFEE